MMIPIQIRETDKILIMAPHPDDECIGCGGILTQYGRQCDVVVATDGSMSDMSVDPARMRVIRKKEFEQEMREANVHSSCMLDYQDGTLINHPDCFDTYDMTRYNVIFLPWVDDNHPDHTACFLHAVETAKKQGVDAVFYQYEVHVPFKDPDTMLDITSTIKQKEKLIELHKSQLKNSCYGKKATALARYRSCAANIEDGYVESYIRTDIFEKESSMEIVSTREKKLAKNVEFVKLLSRWIENEQRGYYLKDSLSKYKSNTVSIYGFSDIGRLTYITCIRQDINVMDILDNRCIDNPDGEHMVIRPQDGNRNVELVIVTAIYDFDEICMTLKEMGYHGIISLKGLIYGDTD